MKKLYLDCSYGISGDMTLSALIDLGADMEYVLHHLKKLPLDEFNLSTKVVDKKGISAKQLVINFNNEDSDEMNKDDHSHHDHHHDHHHEHASDDGHHSHSHRKAADIFQMINESELPERARQRSLDVFNVIAEAEAKIHGMNTKDVHFHEVGAMDSIIDIIGVCLALESLDIGEIVSAPVPTGYGKIMIAHGLYPVPAPATAEILKGVPLLDFEVKGEVTTPTGAAFLKALSNEYGRMPAMTIENIGYGAGKKNFEHPNVLRVFLFEDKINNTPEVINILECQLDDITGETLGYTMGKLFEKGALDVYFTAIYMKKNRPGTLITVLSKIDDTSELKKILLHETSTYGVRTSEWSRDILDRSFIKVMTKFGEVTVKIGEFEGEIIKVSPEFEDAKKIALSKNIPLIDVYNEIEKQTAEQIL